MITKQIKSIQNDWLQPDGTLSIPDKYKPYLGIIKILLTFVRPFVSPTWKAVIDLLLKTIEEYNKNK